MSLQIAKNSSPPYDYYSSGDDSDPISRSVVLDGDGVADVSNVLTAYLVATTYSYTDITVSVVDNPAGVTWEVSLSSGSGFGSSVSPDDMDASIADQTTAVYLRATVADDGSVDPSVVTAPVIRISYIESAE